MAKMDPIAVFSSGDDEPPYLGRGYVDGTDLVLRIPFDDKDMAISALLDFIEARRGL